MSSNKNIVMDSENIKIQLNKIQWAFAGESKLVVDLSFIDLDSEGELRVVLNKKELEELKEKINKII